MHCSGMVAAAYVNTSLLRSVWIVRWQEVHFKDSEYVVAAGDIADAMYFIK